MLAQPERNRNYAEGDIWEAWQHMIAAASEIAAARMFGHDDFVPTVNTFKTELDIPGFEVRYCFTRDSKPHHGLRFNSAVDDPQQRYILIVGGPEEKTRRSADDGYKTPPFRAVGWKLGADCINPVFKAPYGQTNYFLPIYELEDMRKLSNEYQSI